MEELMITRKLAVSAAFSITFALAGDVFAGGDHSQEDDNHTQNTEENARELGEVAATVNDKPIAAILADRVAEQLAAQGQQPDRRQIIDELINLEILTQEAEKIKLNENEKIATALHLQYTQTMANAYLAEYSNDLDIGEDEIRAEYEKQIAILKASEYNASHILLESEEDAKKVIAELKNGGDFAELAKTYSTGPTGENGGELGWFQPENMVPEFSAVLASLEVGNSTADPVQTEFGWHVIQMNDTRVAAKPDYSPAVKAGIQNTLLRQALSEHVAQLREAATVDIK